MINLNQEFLADLGLGGLPWAAQQSLLGHIHKELEIRVGNKLCEGLSEDLLEEFEHLADADVQEMEAWYSKHMPDYRDRPDFKQLRAAMPGSSVSDVMSRFGTEMWLRLNRPGYPEVVADVLQDLRLELLVNGGALRARFAPTG
ncbi:MAG: DUF5663 domain-containing protein [Bifidobacteriaceae bacterium]|jgi:hypothetical protein|nr:DUF5663 domain-containing protein [Bifidobacteriaceae bacterium]